MFMRATYLLQTALLGLAVVSCSSIKSTHVERAKEFCGWQTTHMRGIPTTLEVPHHFKISVIDTYYEKAGSVLRDTNCAAGLPHNVPPPLVKTRSVEVVVENTKEIFTVDFVRPAAGTLTTKAELDADRQY